MADIGPVRTIFEFDLENKIATIGYKLEDDTPVGNLWTYDSGFVYTDARDYIVNAVFNDVLSSFSMTLDWVLMIDQRFIIREGPRFLPHNTAFSLLPMISNIIFTIKKSDNRVKMKLIMGQVNIENVWNKNTDLIMFEPRSSINYDWKNYIVYLTFLRHFYETIQAFKDYFINA